jgi:hypothetical protein
MKKEILQEMLIDEEEIFQSMVGKAKKVFRIDKRGNVIFHVPRKELTQRQIVALQLLGRYFAHELEIVSSELVTADELVALVGADKKSITARLHDLKKEHLIDSPERGNFRISILGADKILDEVLNSLNMDKIGD